MRNSHSTDMHPIEQKSKEYRIPENSQPWCNQVSNDFCPLVISLMGFICLISIILIIYLCLRGTFECNKIRHFFRIIRLKIFKQRFSESARLSYGRSIITPHAMDLSAPIDRSFISRINNYTLSNQNRHIWFTDISKSVPPPPTYDESQSLTIHHVIKPKPINPASVYPKSNSTDITDVQQSVVFPNIRCLTLTSSPGTRSSLNRLGNLSRQLLDQNMMGYGLEINEFTRIGASNLPNDEVPPAYDTIISNNVDQSECHSFQECQFISDEFLV